MSSYVNEITTALIFGKIRDITKEVESCYPNQEEKEELTVEEQVEVAEAIGESNE